MRVILIEFSWHAKKIIDNKESYKKDIIVSLDPESSYILKSNKIPYFETHQFCNHKELWFRYKEITSRSIQITEVLDEALHSTDKRFKDLNWKLFNDYHYPLKISFDQLYYYSELISKLIEKFNPSEIVVTDSGKILVDEWFLIDSRISIIKYLLKTIENNSNKIKINFVLPDQNGKFTTTFLNNFKKFNSAIKSLIKKKIKNAYLKIIFSIDYYTSKPKYLSVNCYEILRYKKLYPNESKFFLSYQHNNLNKKNLINNLSFFEKFTNYLENQTNFYELLKHKNISFKLIFNEILFELTSQFNFLINEHDKAKKIINRIKPACVIFQTAVPYYYPNITFRKICMDYKIPSLVWMHGGYGLTHSFNGGYDVTDFRFFKNHITYGPYLEKTLNNEKNVLKKFNFQENYKFFSVGSARFDYDNKSRILDDEIKFSKKQTILFVSAAPRPRNHFYFGYNREKHESSLWYFHYEILKLLKKYQTKYNIIFKDYTDGSPDLWKKVIKDIKANQITFITNEKNVNELLRISDLNIFPWITTAFFEALYFNADIFAMEEDLFLGHFSQGLGDGIFCFENEDKFKQELDKYLENEIFYKNKKKNSRDYFVNFNAFGRRDKMLDNALSQLNSKSTL